jgi:hypothetical protein
MFKYLNYSYMFRCLNASFLESSSVTLTLQSISAYTYNVKSISLRSKLYTVGVTYSVMLTYNKMDVHFSIYITITLYVRSTVYKLPGKDILLAL